MRRSRKLAVTVAAATLFSGVTALTGGAQTAQAATTVPSWLIPMAFSDSATGAQRSCTGIVLSRTRTLATPDCFTGRSSDDDMAWDFTSSGTSEGGSSGPRYRSHPLYDSATRSADLSVFNDQTASSHGRAPLVAPGDNTLYKAGSTAVFYSWTGATADDETRVKHSEKVELLSAANCAALLGTALPSGTLCTRPAAGAAVVDAADQCFGDAGGALVAGGKLLAVSATKTTGCVKNGVRLYTKVSSYRSLIREWTRDVDEEYRDSGSVVAVEATDPPFVDVCGTNQRGTKLQYCAADNSGSFDLYGYNFVTQLGDFDGNSYGDLLLRTTGGTLYRVPVTQFFDIQWSKKVKLSTGWSKYNRIIAARDISGDGYLDILARDTSGVLWRYDGTSAGKLAARKKISGGWGRYNVITGRGDLSGDGRSDLVARDGSGVLWLYRGNGKGGFAGRTRIGGGWNQYNAIVATGDIDHNGSQDILARTPAGVVYGYNADNSGHFKARKKLATSGWKKYRSLS